MKDERFFSSFILQESAMLVFLSVLLMLGTGYGYLREGLMTAVCMFVNVVLATLITFNVYEPLVNEVEPMLKATFLENYEDCLVICLVFALCVGILRYATNRISYTELDFHEALLRGGAGLFGILTGYIVAGVLTVAFQTLPFHHGFMQFNPRSEPNRPGAALRRLLPPDRVILSMMHRAGAGPFSWGDGVTFDEHGNFSLRYHRYRHLDAKDQAQQYDGVIRAKKD